MVRTGAKPDWRAASLNQFFWQPSRTVPIHCTDNWKRRKVLEQTPVYRSLAGRGWIKYCIVSNITNCTSCRQWCLWHSLFLTTSIYWLMNRNAMILLLLWKSNLAWQFLPGTVGKRITNWVGLLDWELDRSNLGFRLFFILNSKRDIPFR